MNAAAGYALPDDGVVERGPWNPGIESTLPRRFLALTTLYRPENVATPLAEAVELAAFSGLPMPEIVAFRPERLVVHEVLIRVMADLSVPVGETYGDLGVNFRAIVAHILADAVAPHAAAVAETLSAVAEAARTRITAELDAAFAPPAPAPATPKTWRHVLGLAPRPEPPPVDGRSPEERVLANCADWCVRAGQGEDALEQVASAALHRVVSGIVRHRGKLIGDRSLLASLATTLVANDEGSRRIGCLIEPWFAEAVAREGYVPVRAQAAPIVMNVKGASASGKSTMRPLQRALARRLGESWSDFAVITPDIWRKFLLDYDSIGDAIGYAGTLTGHEVEIVDRKLDRYMARKAREGRMSHLLIDRFRFDSFNADSRTQDGSQLLTRFGHRVFMLFMITPPDATVERAWIRGRIFGRYKAVDDLLAHNVEAFTGMPELFFTWAAKADKQVYYEFLDNSVPLGERPRTVAFGENGNLTVLNAGYLIDIARYTKINIDALSPAEVYPDAAALAPERNTGFLRQCARRLRSVRFAEAGSGLVYACFETGRLTCLDRAAFARACADPETRVALAAFGADNPEGTPCAEAPTEILSQARTETLGAWVDPKRASPPA
ncbi:hypothetical protein FV222_05430 [Methylobacterium sp. WL103]|uniref:hypothetical protein n=1 Tax=unclassified Methylobacterium TaxID=2615210 RepID=UPI0011CCA045|nr:MULTISPECIES: hypothetical protein [unclassified Methylobacterium]TXM73392.1 hypothetical protein FV226_09260 [Methylobacterium sp. WL12]TXN06507.1 hypothetical protein FV222_05430 [Methylobacterium sp. WL103]TXN84000.1 hypothetical protein FV234_04630 [Methylobacterium sp. WL8]